jgi:holo-[acyl-carrier protein] synthase
VIVGIGIDVVATARLKSALHRFGERFAARLLAPEEFAEYRGRGALALQYLAGRFAVKEAALKALAVPRSAGWHELITTSGERGEPRLRFAGHCATAARERGVERPWVSVSHDAGVAVAVVVLEASKGP